MENQNDVFETLQNLIKMTEAMLHLVSDAIQVTYQIVEKNNGVKLNALTLIDKDNPSLSPTIYIDQAINRINEGKSDIETEAKRIVNIYKEKMTMLPGFSSIKDFFKPENFFVTVVNKKLNKNRLNEITHTNTKDLTIELRCRVGEDASFAVPVSALTDLKMTRSNALDIGISNSIAYGCDIVPMSTMITNLWDPNPDQELDQDVLDEAIHSTPVDMYVVKSKDALVGAASVYIDPAIRKKYLR